VSDAPAALRVKKHASIATTGSPDQSGLPCAMVLTVSFGLSLVIGLFVTIIGGIFSIDLMPASRHQDHTTSPSTSAPFVSVLPRPSHPAPNVRDDREAPLLRCAGRPNQRI
jgi:hypothetical protein